MEEFYHCVNEMSHNSVIINKVDISCKRNVKIRNITEPLNK